MNATGQKVTWLAQSQIKSTAGSMGLSDFYAGFAYLFCSMLQF